MSNDNKPIDDPLMRRVSEALDTGELSYVYRRTVEPEKAYMLARGLVNQGWPVKAKYRDGNFCRMVLKCPPGDIWDIVALAGELLLEKVKAENRSHLRLVTPEVTPLPLPWKDRPTGSIADASAVKGRYVVIKTRGPVPYQVTYRPHGDRELHLNVWPTMEAAKAAAEVDHAKRQAQQ